MFPNAITKHSRNRSLLIIALVSMVISACSFVRIQNASDAPITVLVRVPDNNQGYYRNIRSDDIVDVFSGYGGRYSVTMLPGEQYQSTLNSIQETISIRLFEERATLTGEEVTRLVKNLQEVEQLLADLALPGVSCSGNLPDFDTSVVIVVWDTAANQWALSCS